MSKFRNWTTDLIERLAERSCVAENVALKEEVERLRTGWPKLSDKLLGHIEAEIIVRTGNGPLASYVVKWLDRGSHG